MVLGELRDRIAGMALSSWDELEAVNNHPLLCIYFKPIYLPADKDMLGREKVQRVLRIRLRGAHVSVVSDFLAICLTLPPYYAIQTLKTICDNKFMGYTGPVTPDTQLIFSQRICSLSKALADNPKNSDLDEILQIIWNASSWYWPWIDNTQCEPILQSAVILYRENEGLNTDKQRRHELTKILFDRCVEGLARPNQPPALELLPVLISPAVYEDMPLEIATQ